MDREEKKPDQNSWLAGRYINDYDGVSQESGEIAYDHIPWQAMNYQQVRSQFGVVMQDASILSGSIRQNNAFNNPSMSVDDPINAARLAALHEDIMHMPMEDETSSLDRRFLSLLYSQKRFSKTFFWLDTGRLEVWHPCDVRP
ncbi:MAG TPA: hypothetical protein VHD63_10625 [Ktedonobacteraceae bacterium]|nr:hypothetical protein [Ktedonobacteraceae bacterium]